MVVFLKCCAWNKAESVSGLADLPFACQSCRSFRSESVLCPPQRSGEEAAPADGWGDSTSSTSRSRQPVWCQYIHKYSDHFPVSIYKIKVVFGVPCLDWAFNLIHSHHSVWLDVFMYFTQCACVQTLTQRVASAAVHEDPKYSEAVQRGFSHQVSCCCSLQHRRLSVFARFSHKIEINGDYCGQTFSG